MLVLRNPEDALRVVDAAVRKLVETRFRQLSGDDGAYDSERCGFMVVIEQGDVIDELERVTGVDLLADVFAESRFGDPDFTPVAEVIEDHGSCYEIAVILNDDGFGIEFFVAKVEGVDRQLLAMCERFAIPAPDLAKP